jgi:hypothetical protein
MLFALVSRAGDISTQLLVKEDNASAEVLIARMRRTLPLLDMHPKETPWQISLHGKRALAWARGTGNASGAHANY